LEFKTEDVEDNKVISKRIFKIYYVFLLIPIPKNSKKHATLFEYDFVIFTYQDGNAFLCRIIDIIYRYYIY